MLTGERPFDGASQSQIEQDITTRDPTPPQQKNPKIPAELQRICLKCLAKSMADRYESADKLAHDLRRWIWSRRWRFLAPAGLLVVCLYGAYVVSTIPGIIPVPVSSSPPVEAIQPVHLALSLRYSDGRLVPSEAVMRTGERFAIVVNADKPAYLAVLQYSADGNLFDVPLRREGNDEKTSLPINPKIDCKLPQGGAPGYQLTEPPGAELVIAVTGSDDEELRTNVEKIKSAIDEWKKTGPVGIPSSVLKKEATRGRFKLVTADDDAESKIERLRQRVIEILGEDRLLVVWNLPPRPRDEVILPGMKK